MNKSTLYFRAMDILSVSFIVLMLIAFLEPLYDGTTGVSQIITYSAFAIFGLFIILIFVFRKTKKDDFAAYCSQKAYHFCGKFLLLWAPMLYIFTASLHGFIDGVRGERSANPGIFAELNIENIIIIMWLITWAVYLAAFNWFRFKGVFDWTSFRGNVHEK